LLFCGNIAIADYILLFYPKFLKTCLEFFIKKA